MFSHSTTFGQSPMVLQNMTWDTKVARNELAERSRSRTQCENIHLKTSQNRNRKTENKVAINYVTSNMLKGRKLRPPTPSAATPILAMAFFCLFIFHVSFIFLFIGFSTFILIELSFVLCISIFFVVSFHLCFDLFFSSFSVHWFSWIF